MTKQHYQRSGQMSDRVRVTWNDLVQGGKVPWNIYDQNGKLLVRSGTMLKRSMIEKMTNYVMYRNRRPDDYEYPTEDLRVNAFDKFNELVWRLESLFKDIESANKEAKIKLERIVRDLLNLIDTEPDATIACVHLPSEYPYSLFHSLQCAILSSMVSQRDKHSQLERESLAAAALTCNISMRELQEELYQHKGKISTLQRAEIEGHPAQTISMLLKAGINDPLLLDIVQDHHERSDGSGYPHGKIHAEIDRGAMILAVTDCYCAMVSGRSYRKPLPVKDALSEFLTDKGKLYDEVISLMLIKETSVFPPGSFVKLKNGEIALVIHRGKTNPVQPVVKSIFGPNGNRYAYPLTRDCGNDEYKISGILGARPNTPLNVSKLWDYL